MATRKVHLAASRTSEAPLAELLTVAPLSSHAHWLWHAAESTFEDALGYSGEGRTVSFLKGKVNQMEGIPERMRMEAWLWHRGALSKELNFELAQINWSRKPVIKDMEREWPS